MMIVLPVLAFRDYADPALWYVGAMGYLVPLFFLTAGMALLMRSKRRRSRGCVVLTCLCLFLSGGGSLMIGGLGASLVLLLLAVDFLEAGRIDRVYFAAFLSILAGDLVNVLAPGNYARAHMIYGRLNPLQAVNAAIQMNFACIRFHFGHGLLVIMLLLALLLGLGCGKRLKRASFLLALVGLAITPAVPAFPLALGYGMAEVISEGGRGCLLVDIGIVVCWEMMAFLLGAQLRPHLKAGSLKLLRRLAAASAALLLVLCIPSFKDTIPFQVTENLVNGEIRAYAESWRGIMDELQARPGELVIIEEQPDPCVGACAFWLSASPDNPVNKDVALYFGNKAIMDGWYASKYGAELPEA